MTDDMTSARRRAMLRVDHAGEYGAVSIYEGQLAVFGRRPGHDRIRTQLREMASQEQAHLQAFDDILLMERIRPTLMSPIWKAAGFTLGATTALLGEKAAHACTEAVESVIEEHYAQQIEAFRETGDMDMAERISSFRDDEIAHRDLASDEGARHAPAYPLLSAVIRTGCRLAIRISERL